MNAKKNADRIVNARGDKIMRAIALEFTGRTVDKTPVDTGRARANWNVSVARPNPGNDEALTSVDQPRVTAQNTANAEGWNAMTGTPAFLANGLPYIESLEDGSSAQAPQGMVKVTIAEIKPWVDGLARRTARGL